MHMSSFRQRVGLIAAFALPLMLIASSATASSGAPKQTLNGLVSLNAASLAHVASVADPEIVSLMADRKITKAEAQLRLTWQRQALLLAAELRDRLGGTFGGV